MGLVWVFFGGVEGTVGGKGGSGWSSAATQDSSGLPLPNPDQRFSFGEGKNLKKTDLYQRGRLEQSTQEGPQFGQGPGHG